MNITAILMTLLVMGVWMRDFYSLLFRDGEKVCFSPDIYGKQIFDWHDWELVSNREYFTINPVEGGRKNENVTARRNFLVEFDTIPVIEQLDYVRSINLPYSTCVYSGGKSYHFILSLDKDLSESEYAAFKRRIFKAVGTAIDKANGNPSRFSRTPNAYRRDKKTYQKLVAVDGELKHQQLEDWLLSRGVGEMADPPHKPNVETSPDDPQWFTDLFLGWRTKQFLEEGAEEGERHHHILLAAFDFKRVGKSKEEAIRRIGAATDKPSSEVEAAINYAWSM